MSDIHLVIVSLGDIDSPSTIIAVTDGEGIGSIIYYPD
jgi:hypothetical protein